MFSKHEKHFSNTEKTTNKQTTKQINKQTRTYTYKYVRDSKLPQNRVTVKTKQLPNQTIRTPYYKTITSLECPL